MDNYKNILSLRKYVRIKNDKNIKKLEKIGSEWVKISASNRLSYEIDWLGIPVIQTPEDLVLMQELIFKLQPDFIIETGIAHGGSLIYYASLMEILRKGKIIGIDIGIRKHNKKAIESHPLFKRIKMIEGDSVSDETIQKVKKLVSPKLKIIICLDSNHKKDHVLKELEVYQGFVHKGGYIVVFDTISSKLAEKGVADRSYINNGPMEAIDAFLKKNKDFEIDKKYNKLYISYNPNGYLKRIK